MTSAWSVRDVSRMLGLKPSLVRRWARDGILEPERGERGEYRLSFRDVVLLRTAAGLARTVPARQLRSSLLHLKEQLRDRSLSGVRISADGRAVVARDGDTGWEPVSGQLILDYEVDSLQAQVEVLGAARDRGEHGGGDADEVDEADDSTASAAAQERWAQARSRPDDDVEGREELCREALELEPGHVGARIDLGHLLHEAGRLEEAEDHYRIAVALDDSNAIAAFDLGVVLEDLGRAEQALAAYETALEADPTLADAHYNAAILCEDLGLPRQASEHRARYRRLTMRTV